MDDFELDEQGPFSPVKVLVVATTTLLLGLCLVSYPMYRVLSSEEGSRAGTVASTEDASAFTCSGCEADAWKAGDDPPARPSGSKSTTSARPNPKNPNLTGAAVARDAVSPGDTEAAPPAATSSATAATPRTTTEPRAGEPVTPVSTTAPAATSVPPVTPTTTSPPAPSSGAGPAPANAPTTTVPTTTAPPSPPGLGPISDLLRSLLGRR